METMEESKSGLAPSEESDESGKLSPEEFKKAIERLVYKYSKQMLKAVLDQNPVGKA
jgi:hypothetical protein